MSKFIIFIVISVVLLAILWGVVHFTSDYDKCYSERENEGHAIFQCCAGMVGGTKSTNYLSETCIECPYLVLVVEEYCHNYPDFTADVISYVNNESEGINYHRQINN